MDNLYNMLEYIITSKNWNCHTAYNIARLCRTYRLYYIIKKLCVSQEACGVVIWCACLLSCLLAEPDINWASVFFPVVNPHHHHCHPTPTPSLTHACTLPQAALHVDWLPVTSWIARKKNRPVGRYDFTVYNSRDREGATRHREPTHRAFAHHLLHPEGLDSLTIKDPGEGTIARYNHQGAISFTCTPWRYAHTHTYILHMAECQKEGKERGVYVHYEFVIVGGRCHILDGQFKKQICFYSLKFTFIAHIT